jgi:predicted AAA+ superfamily ATPase
MIKREIRHELSRLLDEYPVVSILGPRQAGKTTLAQMELRDYDYVNLEVPENRDFAINDPRAFLARYSQHVIIDEIQRVPELLSYIQAVVDESKLNGRFVITGSHQLELRAAITQSLAGRVGLLYLLPLSIAELIDSGVEYKNFSESLFTGFLPRIHAENQRPTTAWSNYYQTYVERDVRQLINLKNASLFESFLKLLAGRAGQVINHASLANDVGVDAKSIRNWLSILEASFIVFKLPPYYRNFGKRLVKSPKYYFTDTGLLCFLLGIHTPEQVERDPLVGNLYENLVVIECLKARFNQGQQSNLFFFRDSNGREIDLIFEKGRKLDLIEIKAGFTFTQRYLSDLRKVKSLIDQVENAYLVFNGEPRQMSENIHAIHTSEIKKIFTD